jgi:hypothetical protein
MAQIVNKRKLTAGAAARDLRDAARETDLTPIAVETGRVETIIGRLIPHLKKNVGRL